MPYRERDIEKLYYRIGEVSKWLGVRASHIRFLEIEFDIPVSKRNRAGVRMYTVAEVSVMKDIIEATKHLKLEAAKEQYKAGKLADFVQWWRLNIEQ